MEYQDFPILNDNVYQFLNDQYNSNKANKKNFIISICNDINHIIISSLNLYNSRITKELGNCKASLSKILNNLSSLFSITIKPASTINTITLFDFLINFNNLINNFFQWLKLEEKEYYRSIIHKTVDELLEKENQLIKSLNDSNIKFYKHM